MKLFCADFVYSKVKQVEVERISTANVFFADGSKDRLKTQLREYHKTYEEADQAIRTGLERRINDANERLKMLTAELAQLDKDKAKFEGGQSS